MKHFAAPMEVKALTDSGSFSGYASIFGNVDLGGDVVQRGAFKEFAFTKDGHIKVCDNHAQRITIGKAVVQQDERGLAFDGQLLLSIAAARDAYERMKFGILDEMSIGYDVLPGGAKINASGIRELTGLKLWEISPVTFAMNPAAGIDNVKAVETIETIRDLEAHLRDAGGFSKEAAKAVALHGFAGLQKRRDAGDADTEAANELAALLRGARMIL